MAVLGVIPARYGSTRLEGKPLAELGGRPLIAHVIAHAREARSINRLVVATDDERIARAAREAGAEALLTPGDLPSGSDRVAHVERLLSQKEAFDVILNIQGDEPFLPGSAMDAAVDQLRADHGASMATLAVPADPQEWGNPNVVKVVVDKHRRALYFSRAAIPHGGQDHFLKHLGLYAFRRDYLRRWASLKVSNLEQAERLEQLRALEDGAKIVVAIGNWAVLGVDTPEDLQRAQARLAGASREKETTA